MKEINKTSALTENLKQYTVQNIEDIQHIDTQSYNNQI
jgi:hypothetical protein